MYHTRSYITTNEFYFDDYTTEELEKIMADILTRIKTAESPEILAHERNILKLVKRKYINLWIKKTKNQK